MLTHINLDLANKITTNCIEDNEINQEIIKNINQILDKIKQMPSLYENKLRNLLEEESQFLVLIKIKNFEVPFLSLSRFVNSLLVDFDKLAKNAEKLEEKIIKAGDYEIKCIEFSNPVLIDEDLNALLYESNELGKEILLKKQKINGICKDVEESVGKSKNLLNSLDTSEVFNFSLSLNEAQLKIL